MGFDVSERVKTKIENDPLSHILHLLQLKSVFYTNSYLTQPWGIEIPMIPNSMMFHFVVSGEMYADIAGRTYRLEEGDFIIVPHGRGHHIYSEGKPIIRHLEELPLVCVTERYETLEFGGNGPACELICGAVNFEHPIAERLNALLPDVLFVENNNSDLSNIIGTLLKLLSEETKSIGIGGEAVITRYADIVLIKAIREYLQTKTNIDVGWFKAMKDHRLGRIMAMMHDAPGNDWNLDSLAEYAGMSRTAFSQHFRKVVGETPIDYLTNWRMAVAYKELQSTTNSISNISMDLGYKSEASFSRAFKKVIGLPPGQVRRLAEATVEVH